MNVEMVINRWRERVLIELRGQQFHVRWVSSRDSSGSVLLQQPGATLAHGALTQEDAAEAERLLLHVEMTADPRPRRDHALVDHIEDFSRLRWGLVPTLPKLMPLLAAAVRAVQRRTLIERMNFCDPGWHFHGGIYYRHA